MKITMNKGKFIFIYSIDGDISSLIFYEDEKSLHKAVNETLMMYRDAVVVFAGKIEVEYKYQPVTKTTGYKPKKDGQES